MEAVLTTRDILVRGVTMKPASNKAERPDYTGLLFGPGSPAFPFTDSDVDYWQSSKGKIHSTV
jgi:hypothetical protein